MKIHRSVVICTALLGAVVALAAPKPQMRGGRDIVDTALGVHKFDTFLMLLRDSDLTFSLKRSGPYTVFAPTDEAFNRVPAGWVQRLSGNRAMLRRFILDHVVRGNYTVGQAIRMRRMTAMDGHRLILRNGGGHGTIGGAGFTVANIRTSNGMLHGIDKVEL